MRYENPSIHDSLINLKIEGFDNIYVVPLYPHNAMSTVVTTQVEVLKIANEIYKEANIKFI
jgi:ferrochelatase